MSCARIGVTQRRTGGYRKLISHSLLLAILCSGGSVLAGNPNACDHPSKSPDVIVGDIDEVVYWGSVGDKSAFSAEDAARISKPEPSRTLTNVVRRHS